MNQSLVSIIDKIYTYIQAHPNPNISLLRQKQVLQWLFDDISFLPPIENKNKTHDESQYKIHEDNWGRAMLKLRRPDLKVDKQWTGRFGEYICEEILLLHGKTVTKPPNKNNYQPDLEDETAIWEAKTETYFTSGTAGEKILGCPYKYADVPELYGKPLHILCIGGAEKSCKTQYGIFEGPKSTPKKKEFLAFYEKQKITYKTATSMLKQCAGL